MRNSPLVVALGGNTLLGEHGPWTIDEQLEVIHRTATRLAAAIEDGYTVVLTHGNGPQVGNLLLQQERTTETPQLPLDVLVAETQAQIGYLLQQSLDNALSPPTADYLTVVTQVLVDNDDPAFENPTKPIGPFYTESEAAQKPFETRKVSGGDNPYRRVVPSPEPIELIEHDEIAQLVNHGSNVICAGGGGIPVVRDNGIRGVAAVVDKDKSSQLLATYLGSKTLVLLTDVKYAYKNYGDPDEQPIKHTTVSELRSYLSDGEFGEGSMKPKVEASIRFIENGGELAVITSPENFLGALSREAGTRITQ